MYVYIYIYGVSSSLGHGMVRLGESHASGFRHCLASMIRPSGERPLARGFTFCVWSRELPLASLTLLANAI